MYDFMEFTMESDRLDLTPEQVNTLRKACPKIHTAVADMRYNHVYIVGDEDLTTYEASDYLDILVNMFNLDWDRVTLTVNGRI